MQPISYSRQWKLTVRWSLIAGITAGLFWITWYLIYGSVPVTDKILWLANEQDRTRDVFLQLPVALSRWWDIPSAMLWSTVIIGVISFTLRKKPGEQFDIGEQFYLYVILLIAGSCLGLSLGLGLGLGLGLNAGSCLALGAGLGAGLTCSLCLGLVVGLGLGLVTGLGAGLKYLTKTFLPACRAIGRWLIASE